MQKTETECAFVYHMATYMRSVVQCSRISFRGQATRGISPFRSFTFLEEWNIVLVAYIGFLNKCVSHRVSQGPTQ